MSDVVVVGHQPQYMPYLGILHKISKADIFIVVDHVQFVKKYFYNRTYIKVNGESQLLSIPVLTKGKYKAPISEIKINYEVDWIRKHLKSIQFGYSKAPYFKKYFGEIEQILLKKHSYLSGLTSELLVFFLKEFDLAEDIRFSSSMDIKGHQTELLINLTKTVGGSVYVSGEGAKDYFDEAAFNKSGLKHNFSIFKHPAYPQQGENVLAGMGCIDLLLNCGPDGRKYIIEPEKYS